MRSEGGWGVVGWVVDLDANVGRRCKKTYRITTPTANGVDGTKRMLQIEYQQTNNTRDTKGHERVKEVRKKFGRKSGKMGVEGDY